MLVTKLFTDFTNNERAGGIVLIGCTIISLVAANLLPGYHDFWHLSIGSHSLTHWINDGLMTIFFLLIGLELEREVYCGELSSFRSALLPAIAALGGMAVPAVLYSYSNIRGGDPAGIGIPMATDIAFALAVLSLVGKRVPTSLKVFLTALAVMDDLGAILVIAIFYTSDIHWLNLAIAGGVWIVLFIFNRLKIHHGWPYLAGGVAMWYFMMGSGVHATITGVIVAFAIPFGSGAEQTLSYRLQHFLHKPVAFLILPLFALANTSILIQEGFYQGLGSAVSIGIMLGLVLGKPLGIFTFTYAAVKTKISALAGDVTWKHILGAGILGGIGFTMSIFISLLAFSDKSTIDHAKIAVLIASLVSGVVGLVYLKQVIRKQRPGYGYVIRSARTDEHDMIGNLLVRVYASLEGFPKEHDQPEYYTVLRNVGTLTAKPGVSVWVAVNTKDQIAGAVVYFADIAHYGSGGIATQQQNAAGFRLLAVDDAHRGKGIATLLTQACIDEGNRTGRIQLILHTTAYMKNARNLYEKMGFTRASELDFMQGEMEVLGFRMPYSEKPKA